MDWWLLKGQKKQLFIPSVGGYGEQRNLKEVMLLGIWR